MVFIATNRAKLQHLVFQRGLNLKEEHGGFSFPSHMYWPHSGKGVPSATGSAFESICFFFLGQVNVIWSLFIMQVISRVLWARHCIRSSWRDTYVWDTVYVLTVPHSQDRRQDFTSAVNTALWDFKRSSDHLWLGHQEAPRSGGSVAEMWRIVSTRNRDVVGGLLTMKQEERVSQSMGVRKGEGPL